MEQNQDELNIIAKKIIKNRRKNRAIYFGIEFVALPQIFFTMKYIKILSLFLIFSFGVQKSYSQPIRFKTNSVSFADKKANGTWNEWSEFVPANILIALDAKKPDYHKFSGSSVV